LQKTIQSGERLINDNRSKIPDELGDVNSYSSLLKNELKRKKNNLLIIFFIEKKLLKKCQNVKMTRIKKMNSRS
jgi:hypothetical protein